MVGFIKTIILQVICKLKEAKTFQFEKFANISEIKIYIILCFPVLVYFKYS